MNKILMKNKFDLSPENSIIDVDQIKFSNIQKIINLETIKWYISIQLKSIWVCQMKSTTK